MISELKRYIPIADSIAILFHPYAEVVIHSLKAKRIVHIAHAYSRRRTGDSSLTELRDVQSTDQHVIGPYRKTNVDGRPLKSISAVLPDSNGRPIGLICINVDVSLFEAVQSAVRQFLAVPDPQRQPAVLFEGDWREEISAHVGEFLVNRQLRLETLPPAARAELLRELEVRGVFAIRGAAVYVARALGISRASLYASLKDARSRRPGAKHDVPKRRHAPTTRRTLTPSVD